MIYKIYALIDPRDFKIKYIGITSRSIKKRLHDHINEKSKDKRGRWIKKLLQLNLIPKMLIIEVIDCNSEEAKQREIFWIQISRCIGYELKNSTDGGDGILCPSPEVRRKMSSARKKYWTKERRIALSLKYKNRKFSDEWKSNISRSKLKTTCSSETRKKMSKSHMGNKSNTGRRLSEETKRKIGAASSLMWKKRKGLI